MALFKCAENAAFCILNMTQNLHEDLFKIPQFFG